MRDATERIVLIHGLGCDARFWTPQVPALRPLVAELRAPNLPYHGGPAQDVPKSLQGLASWVARTQASGPAVLIGHSLGGMIALQIAHDSPELVKGIALVDSFVHLGLSAAHLPGMFVQGRHEATRRWVEQAREEIIGRMTQETYDAIWPSVRDFTAAPWLHEVSCPVMGIYGGRGLCGPDDARRLLAGLMLHRVAGPTSVVVVPEAGHFVNLECPDVVNEALLAWLARSRSDDR